MGFFSKLIKDAGLDELGKNIAEAASELKKGITGEQTANNSQNAGNASWSQGSAGQTAQGSPSWTQNPAAQAARAAAPSGQSWGEVMPDEENQFNYRGTYLQYFEDIFAHEFAEYEVSRETVSDGKRHIFTFRSGDRTALVVELMAQSSASRKLREKCRRSGTPYLRYYYDHEGWWNTRAYVTERTRKALGAR